MKTLSYIFAALLICVGTIVVYLGEFDDSPGLGGIVLLLILSVMIWRGRSWWGSRRS